jgi:FkbM family methyltransferase
MITALALELNIPVKGIMHIGANDCIEYEEYKNFTQNIIYLEANPKIVDKIKVLRPEINIYNALITDRNDDDHEFKISNNDGQSSSILNFALHKINHPSVFFIESIPMKSITVDSFISKNSINMKDINILVIDIQGVELRALKGSISLLPNIDIIYTEVNTDETYEGCDKIHDIDIFLNIYCFKRIKTNIFPGHTYGDAVYKKI